VTVTYILLFNLEAIVLPDR